MSRTAGAKDKKPRARRADGNKPAWSNSPVIQDQQNLENLPEGYNSRRIAFMMDILPTEPLDSNDVDEMERRFQRYLQKCAEWDMKVGNQAAYAAIGIDKDDVYNWVARISTNPKRGEFVKKVQKICALYREGLMEDGKVNPVTGIFWQKNYDGLRDQQEVVLTPNQSPLGEQKDAESLRQKYLESTYNIAESENSQKGAERDSEAP